MCAPVFFCCWCSVARIVAVGDMRAWGDEEQETIGWTTTTEKVLSRISTVNNANGVDVVAIAGDLSCKLVETETLVHLEPSTPNAHSMRHFTAVTNSGKLRKKELC